MKQLNWGWERSGNMKLKANVDSPDSLRITRTTGG
jgi:hypothetical protein